MPNDSLSSVPVTEHKLQNHLSWDPTLWIING